MTAEKESPPREWRLADFFIPALIIVLYALLAAQPELRLAVPLLVGVTAAVVMLLAGVLFRPPSSGWSLSLILGVALLLRLMFLFHPPQLSDDIYRYVWDGSRLLAGINPYAAAPAQVVPPSHLAHIHARINHPRFVTIYPPAAQVVFAAGALPGPHVIALKTFLVLLDLVLCGLLVVLLKRLELPPWRAVLYAWNPLPILEISGSGHIDGAGLTMLMGALGLLLSTEGSAIRGGSGRIRYACAGGLAGCAGLVKLFPFVLLPVLFLLVPRGFRRFFAGGLAAASAGLALPFMPQMAHMLSSLDAYARTWEFAGFAFTTLRRLTGSGSIGRIVPGILFLIGAAVATHAASRRIRQHPSGPERGRAAIRACAVISLCFLLLTPTLQPWYALCLAVFLPFCPAPAGIVLCWAVFMTYRVQIPYFILGQWLEDYGVTAAVFMAPLVAGMLGLIGRHAAGADRSSPAGEPSGAE